ncbi:MAG: hypothetical protein RBS73_11540 [Prolixibacteraceae bacterium]|nr:hypothetical protein [Prolixibacteraceae bacterium]
MMRTVLLLFLICLTLELSAQRKQLFISKEKVELTITEKNTETQLKKFQKTLKEEANIDFNFKDIIYNSKKEISKITIEINSNDGISGSGTLMTSNIYNVGFIRDYSSTGNPSSQAPLIIGNISEKEIKLD